MSPSETQKITNYFQQSKAVAKSSKIRKVTSSGRRCATEKKDLNWLLSAVENQVIELKGQQWGVDPKTEPQVAKWDPLGSPSRVGILAHCPPAPKANKIVHTPVPIVALPGFALPTASAPLNAVPALTLPLPPPAVPQNQDNPRPPPGTPLAPPRTSGFAPLNIVLPSTPMVFK